MQGQVEDPIVSDLPSYDKACYLCPGNDRAGGYTNPDYKQVFVSENAAYMNTSESKLMADL